MLNVVDVVADVMEDDVVGGCVDVVENVGVEVISMVVDIVW